MTTDQDIDPNVRFACEVAQALGHDVRDRLDEVELLNEIRQLMIAQRDRNERDAETVGELAGNLESMARRVCSPPVLTRHELASWLRAGPPIADVVRRASGMLLAPELVDVAVLHVARQKLWTGGTNG